MEKYKIKEEEAIAFADFLAPMLRYQPDQRATAQEMLNHPWLNMPANFDYMMSDREYQAMIMKSKEKKKKPERNEDSTDVIDSDIEINMADDEDNDEYDSDSSFDSVSKEKDFPIQNFNNSFAAYGQHMNLDALDRANPQFEVLN